MPLTSALRTRVRRHHRSSLTAAEARELLATLASTDLPAPAPSCWGGTRISGGRGRGGAALVGRPRPSAAALVALGRMGARTQAGAWRGCSGLRRTCAPARPGRWGAWADRRRRSKSCCETEEAVRRGRGRLGRLEHRASAPALARALREDGRGGAPRGGQVLAQLEDRSSARELAAVLARDLTSACADGAWTLGGSEARGPATRWPPPCARTSAGVRGRRLGAGPARGAHRAGRPGRRAEGRRRRRARDRRLGLGQAGIAQAPPLMEPSGTRSPTCA
jgi:hypothetical protein